jgi:hypothetical protein
LQGLQVPAGAGAGGAGRQVALDVDLADEVQLAVDVGV